MEQKWLVKNNLNQQLNIEMNYSKDQKNQISLLYLISFGNKMNNIKMTRIFNYMKKMNKHFKMENK